MTHQHQQRTAKIYAFPKQQRTAAHTATESNNYDPRFDMVEYGTGWYHQSAVEDAAADLGVQHRKH